ncbi:hypothetical protein CBM2589_B120376 [Cupriavidus taiwanensis]|uniref:Uncharacterized protein n=1 Tax=Cupriavidus taiwanensis TaxID=164546 RepID=A0A375BH84_9BURK|nr:hypothetical protein CBM2589_B120376 [Cupriavidus taiwanensis]
MYRHMWRECDVLMWGNGYTTHYAVHDWLC